ncbi:MAG: hypothetical protein ACKOPE_10585 [Novosphingobium sp.]
MHWGFYSFFWPVFWIGFWALRSAFKHRQRMAELELQSRQSSLAAKPNDANELDELRARVKVLERITVDERRTRNLANEIESLRER